MIRRLRGAWAVTAAFVVGCLLQSPGKLVADTKLDLAISPGRFLGRALHLWDPTAALGHVPNQVAGYLFPMGPWFAAWDLLPLPMWVGQRLWLAAVLTVAFWGALRLARRLEVGTEPTRLVAAAAYAVAPAVLAALFRTSAHQLPAALVRTGRRGAQPRPRPSP
jgi:arabinofuranan 3-O-arabinosyltransferase